MSIEVATKEIAKNTKLFEDIGPAYKINMFACIMAVIKIESDFNPNEVMDEKNVKDFSIGYMQGRIETARWVMNWWLLSRDEIKKRLFDPAQNITFGIKYLIRQIKRYNGNLKKAIPAYNAGAYIERNGKCINQGYYDKWAKAYKEFGGNLFMEENIK